ncbi:MAG: CarD family transcriptional regulator [Bryobacter sp.]|jgi:CarD family transcriptional regulator|nr:CarD family transcriptional regulator [Bryobacter sp. CoA8 C33]
MTFQVGEKVVYPNHGVGTIENISIRSFGAQNERFYLLKLAYSSMTVMVPFSHAEGVGLRKVTKNTEIAKVLNFLATGMPRWNPDWKHRFKENTEKMSNGSLSAIAEVFKTLLLIQGDKPLSFREKKMLERSRQMLLAEVAISRSLLEKDAIDLLDRSLQKAKLRFPEPI